MLYRIIYKYIFIYTYYSNNYFERYTYTHIVSYIYIHVYIYIYIYIYIHNVCVYIYTYANLYIHPLTHSMLLLGSYMKLLFFLFRTFYPSPDWDTPTEFTADIWSISCLRNSSSNGRKKKCSCKRTENEATGKRCNFRFCLCELVDSTANSCRFWPAKLKTWCGGSFGKPYMLAGSVTVWAYDLL